MKRILRDADPNPADMKAGKQRQIKIEKAIPEVITLLGQNNLDTYVCLLYTSDAADE